MIHNYRAVIRDYTSLLNTYHLQNIIKENTRISQNSQTLIDHILVTDKKKVVTHGIFDPCISDHSLVYIVLPFKRQRKPPIYITVKNYEDVDIKTLQSDFQQTPWWVTSVFDDIDDTTSVSLEWHVSGSNQRTHQYEKSQGEIKLTTVDEQKPEKNDEQEI